LDGHNVYTEQSKKLERPNKIVGVQEYETDMQDNFNGKSGNGNKQTIFSINFYLTRKHASLSNLCLPLLKQWIMRRERNR
jgi:hypothetical protein